jgi:hypothetical protein
MFIRRNIGVLYIRWAMGRVLLKLIHPVRLRGGERLAKFRFLTAGGGVATSCIGKGQCWGGGRAESALNDLAIWGGERGWSAFTTLQIHPTPSLDVVK